MRLGLGGAQARVPESFPTSTVTGKILGGGFPLIAAFGGRADVMAVLAPGGPCFTGGTHAGNPFAVAVGACAFSTCSEQHAEVYAAMDGRAKRLAEGIRTIV